jgi:hypothetical protein
VNPRSLTDLAPDLENFPNKTMIATLPSPIELPGLPRSKAKAAHGGSLF